MDKEYAKYLLNKTREDYNRIAEQFSRTRAYAWGEFNYLANFVKDGDRVLDIGCGNGRLLELFKDKKIDYTGIDNSEKLIEIAKKIKDSRFKIQDSAKFLVADALNLPFEDNSFDKVFSIAVLHHIPSKKLRLEFLREAGRVLKPGGLLVITTWSLWGRLITWKYLLKFIGQKIFGRAKLDFGDLFIPWQKKIGRYFHSFTRGELRRLAEEAGFKVKEIGVLKRKESENRNIYLIAEKPTY